MLNKRTGENIVKKTNNKIRYSIMISSFALFGLGLAYAVVLGLGLYSLKHPTDPIGNPYVSIMEVIILLMTPFMDLLAASMYLNNVRTHKLTNFMSVVFMIIATSITSGVHIVVLSINNHAWTGELSWLRPFLAWEWPSVVYALDILAWDFFFALAILCLVPNYYRRNHAISVLLSLSGILSLVGLIGPVISDMQFRLIGVFGYAGLFPAACILIGIHAWKNRMPLPKRANSSKT